MYVGAPTCANAGEGDGAQTVLKRLLQGVIITQPELMLLLCGWQRSANFWGDSVDNPPSRYTIAARNLDLARLVTVQISTLCFVTVQISTLCFQLWACCSMNSTISISTTE